MNNTNLLTEHGITEYRRNMFEKNKSTINNYLVSQLGTGVVSDRVINKLIKNNNNRKFK